MSARDDSESAAPDVPAAGVVLDKRALFELLTGAPFAVVAYEGADHVAVLSNPKHDEMTHGRVLLGRPLLASIPELAGQPAVTTLDDVYATGETKKALAMPAKLERGGSLQDCWFDVTWQPMRDGRGQISGVLVTAVEVSDHVIARRAAEEAQRKFVAIFEHAAFAIALVKMPGAVIVDVNPAWTELFGFSRQETLGKTSVEIGLRPDPEARARIWKEFVERGVVRNAENTVRAKNGKTRIISNSLDAIELDGQAYLLGTYQDVTEQREAERRLRENEHQFRGLVDNLPELAWSAEADGHIDFYNRRWYEFTGKTFEQMEGWGWKSVHDPAHVDEVVARWSQSLDSGDPFEMEFPLLGADGVFRWFLTRIRPLRDLQGKIVRWVGINTDIDQARRAQLERDALLATTQRALEVRDEFLSIAAHELRTPLTALQLQVQVSMRTVAREPSQHVALSKLESAWRQTQRLGKLVDQLLDVSRLSRGGLELQLEEVELNALVHGVVERLSLLAQRAKSVFSVDCQPGLVGRWDRLRLEEVLTNLVTNAIKYGSGTPIEITARRGDDRLIFSVTDHGIGIERADLDRIFEKFERAVSSKNYGGLGLGLYISRQIVLAHGGRIEVRSHPGDGTTMTVSLPFAPPPGL